MKVHIVSLGCPKNTVDTEASLGILQEMGCVAVDDPSDADLLIVNACSFMEGAWRETVEEVEELARVKETGSAKKLVLMGCLPLHRGDGWRDSFPFVDHFLPPGGHARLVDVVDSMRGNRRAGTTGDAAFDPFAGIERRPRITPRHVAYVKIADGCDHACAFCAIPLIRGAMRSRPLRSIVREVEALRADGVKEICLVAQDITSYSDGGARLADLVDSIVRTGIDWVRLFYVHPGALTADLARRFFGHPSVCRYLEVPVQHASDRILEKMGRRYTRTEIERRLAAIRAEFPDVVVRSEVMVGYPGETDEDFEALKAFVESAGFASLGVFVYSPEPGTAASELADRVPKRVASERAAEIADLQRSVTFGLLSGEKGRRHRVLIDRKIEDGDEGHGSHSYAGRYYGQAYEIDGEVYVETGDLAVGEFADVRITGADVFDLEGRADDSQRP